MTVKRKSSPQKKKLVLFDIDGTLIYHVGNIPHTLGRFSYGIKKVYGYSVTTDLKHWKYDGWVERAIVWDMLKSVGVRKDVVIRKLPELGAILREFLERYGKSAPLYKAIPDAKKLVLLLRKHKNIKLGVLTGNFESAAWWKLTHTGYDGYFQFGLFGEEEDDRIALARRVFDKARRHFGSTFLAGDIVVIGDTTHDIVCAKAIGAHVIAVTTGMHGNRAELLRKHPTIVVDSLMDKRVLDLLGLEK